VFDFTPTLKDPELKNPDINVENNSHRNKTCKKTERIAQWEEYFSLDYETCARKMRKSLRNVHCAVDMEG
jgi:hypothetical protein